MYNTNNIFFIGMSIFWYLNIILNTKVKVQIGDNMDVRAIKDINEFQGNFNWRFGDPARKA